MINKLYTEGGSKKLAFSLAEVMVVIFILGVVAIETIPTIIKTYQDKVRVVSLKKSFSTLSQATNMMIAEYGSLRGLCEDDDHACWRNKYAEFLKPIIICDATESKGTCWHESGDSYFLSGGPVTWGNYPGMVLNNGVFIRWTGDVSSDCSAVNNTLNFCARILIDTNGWEKPNTYGRDIFYLWVTENGLKPGGVPEDNFPYTRSCKTTSTGYGCASKVLKEDGMNY